MQILEISYGKFPDISFLNPNFKAHSTKIRVVLDILLPQKEAVNLSSIYRKVHKLMPTLSKHRCCTSLLYGSVGGQKEGDIPLKRIGDITDIAHMMEHMIIDLQANVSRMDSCSGITCGYQEPDFRFDLFIECKDKDVARFSIYLTLDIIKRALLGKRVFPRYRRIIRLARYLYQHPRRVDAFGRISKDLNLPSRSIRSLLKDLAGLKYFSKGNLPPSDKKKRGKKWVKA